MQKINRISSILFTLIVLIIALTTSWTSHQFFSTSVPALLILQLSVVFVALNCRVLYTYSIAVMEAVSFNFLFTEPVYTFQMSHTEDVVDLVTFIIIAFIIIRLTNYYRRQQEKLNQTYLRNSLLLSVSHDLKTPLTTIIGTLSSLKEYMPKLTEKEQIELVDCATSDSLRLSQYIDNLLHATKLQHGTLNLCLESSLIAPIIHKAAERFTSQNQRIDISIQDCAIPLLLSKSLIEQAIFNILDNALRYTPNTLPVKLDCYLEKGSLLIDIRDFGAGIEQETAQRVFEAFFTKHEPRLLGTGLGMGVAAGIIRAHKGTIESVPVSEGSLIRMRLPFP